MTSVRPGPGRALFLSLALVAALGAFAPAALADRPPPPRLDWEPCGEAGAECATAEVPRDYDRPRGRTLEIAVARTHATDPSRRVGSLFFNFGGPGGTAVEFLREFGTELFPTLSDRFDIVAFDPRGVGESSPSIDCRADQEALGVYAQPFETPLNLDVGAWIGRDVRYIERCLRLNPDIFPWVSTANVARDMDLLRAALAERRLSYLGFSYGTQIGATYASLFPNRYRALVLDGALDVDQYMNEPMEALREQSSGFEMALGRFFQACARDQVACQGFGGEDPWAAFDELIERAYASPLPAGGDDPRPVDGDDVNVAAVQASYSKFLWPLLAQALAMAEAGDGTGIRELVNIFYGRLPDGTYDPLLDRYFTIGAAEQRYPRNLRVYKRAGRHSWGLFPHAWWNAGYVELAWGLFPVQARDAYYGPFDASSSAPTVLVVGTTYDPATPYRWSKILTADLGNARLLTMRGDGHTAYGGQSACIDAAVDAYLEDGALPPEGTVCRQEVPFAAPEAAGRGAASLARRVARRHVQQLMR
jgi:pimeloyl-ACP methyl ester carboxylesterase